MAVHIVQYKQFHPAIVRRPHLSVRLESVKCPLWFPHTYSPTVACNTYHEPFQWTLHIELPVQRQSADYGFLGDSPRTSDSRESERGTFHTAFVPEQDIRSIHIGSTCCRSVCCCTTAPVASVRDICIQPLQLSCPAMFIDLARVNVRLLHPGWPGSKVCRDRLCSYTLIGCC